MQLWAYKCGICLYFSAIEIKKGSSALKYKEANVIIWQDFFLIDP